MPSGGVSSVTFSNIPQTYAHLQIRWIARSSVTGGNAADVTMRFNGDTASNYAGHQINGDGATASASTLGGTPPVSYLYPSYITSNSATANSYGTAIVDILDYTSISKYKTMKSLNGHDNNGNGFILFRSGLWMSTSALSSIILEVGAYSFMANSSFALYGVKI